MQVTFALGEAGARTMPAVPKNLPRVMGTPLHVGDVYTVPSTPKTAPTPFYPTTPSKSRPAKTPVTVAAFRKRRSQLAASAFKECGSPLQARTISDNPVEPPCRLTEAEIITRLYDA